MLRVLDIIAGTSVDGPGLRTAIYFAGCDHACPGCHNPDSHDPKGGKPMSIDEIITVVEAHGFNVTFSGGDPLQQPADELAELARRLTEIGYTIWCFTGYLYEHIHAHPALKHVEVLVDGPFIEALRDTDLIFRGSSNQRLIALSTSTPDSPTLWHSSF